MANFPAPKDQKFTSYIVDNDRRFADALAKMEKATDDFRIPLGQIGADFYRSERIIFQLKSEGLYQDLAPAPGKNGNPTTTSNYKEKKIEKFGFAYPILKRTGRLSASLLSPNAAGSVFQLGNKTLVIGTDIDYAIYHQSDLTPRSKIPKRKFIFISGGEDEVAKDSRITGRIERWLNIIENYTKQITEGTV
jgi:phage gpG-like protein